MHIFALETDTEKLTKSFLSADETPILTVRFHVFLFLIQVLRSLIMTALVLALAATAIYFGMGTLIVLPAACVLWIVIALYPLLRGFIDWRYDLTVITSEKLVIVNQSSIFHRDIRQMNLDNIATVHASTQHWNIFPFGKVCFDLKEGTGQRFCISYIPAAARVANVISDAVVLFQRRRAAMQKQG